MLYEINCIVFGERCLVARVSLYTKISQYITEYGGKFYKIYFEMVIVQKLNKVYVRSLVAEKFILKTGAHCQNAILMKVD